MGAEPYQYVVDVQDNIQLALDKLRAEVFEAGQFYGADRGPKTPEQALEFAGAHGGF